MRLGLSLAINRRYHTLAAGGIPPDASGLLGDVYLDTSSGTWYEKRWVANREGTGDSILFPINLFPSVGDFDFSVMVRRDNLQDGGLRLFAPSPSRDFAATGFVGAGLNYHSASLYNSAGTLQYTLNATPTDNKWHKLGVSRIGTAFNLLVDGVVVSTNPSTGAWSPSLSQTGMQFLFTANTASLSIKCCDLRLTGPGGSIIAPLNEGSGTVITNQAGANGTLTDGAPANFWYQAWVPVQNPAADFRIPTNSGIFPALFS